MKQVYLPLVRVAKCPVEERRERTGKGTRKSALESNREEKEGEPKEEVTCRRCGLRINRERLHFSPLFFCFSPLLLCHCTCKLSFPSLLLPVAASLLHTRPRLSLLFSLREEDQEVLPFHPNSQSPSPAYQQYNHT